MSGGEARPGADRSGGDGRGGDVDGFVLAGGASVRMGSDKARVPWQGRPMAEVVGATLAAVCRRVALVRRGPPDGLPWGLPVVRDAAHEGTHPLFGVAAALEAAGTERVLIAPCDVPRLSEGSLRALLAAGEPAVACDGERRHPLVAVIPARWAGRARQAAVDGASVHAFVAGCRSVVLPAGELVNHNRPDDLPTGPVARLLAGLPWLDAAGRRRVALGEIGRLAARGMVDPDAADWVR